MLRTYLQYKPAWLQLLLFVAIAFSISQLLLLIALPIVSSATHIGIGTITSILSGTVIHPQSKTILILFQSLNFVCLFLIPTLLYAHFASEQPNTYLGLTTRTTTKYFLYAIALLLVGIIATAALGLLNKLIPMPASWVATELKQNAAIESIVKANNIGDLLLSIVVVGLFAAIGEELFFRAVLQRIIIQWVKQPLLGIVITAVVFSAIHLQFSGFLPRVLLGFVLGCLYWYSGSIWVSIAFHFMYNTFGVVVAYFAPSQLKANAQVPIQTLQLYIFGAVALVFIFIIIIKMKAQSLTNFDKVYPKQQNFFS